MAKCFGVCTTFEDMMKRPLKIFLCSAVLAIAILFSIAVTIEFTQFVPYCNGVDDTSKFTDAISIIGSNQATITLPYRIISKRCAVNDLTIPSNITLDNTNGSGIKINTGKTLT